jgi:hypothetical protein
MKIRLITLVAVLAVLFASIAPGAALAGAYDTAFTTSITYQNIGTAATTTLNVLFYATPTTTTPITISRPALAAGAGTSLFIGGLTEINPGFRGAAVMQSDQPLLATLVQLPQASTTVRNRPLSNGFSGGSNQSLIATVLKNQFDTNTIFSVQNVGPAQTTITIQFYDTTATLRHTISSVTVERGAAYYVDAGQVAQLPSPFNGSAVVTAAAGGQIVASAMELAIGGVAASAFEGVGAGDSTFYMPSALCEAFGANTAYAIQNTNLSTAASVTVNYSNGATETKSIGPGAKASFIACQATGMSAGFSGAAVITSNQPIIAIGKAYGSGLSTAFVGFASGSDNIALPYVRWATDANFGNGSQQRVFLTIQNIGTAAVNGATVKYVDRDGNVVGTHTLPSIAPQAKVNSNASAAGLTEFGVYAGGTQFGGGAIVEGPDGSQLAVVARVSTQVGPGSFASEDYNGMPIP